MIVSTEHRCHEENATLGGLDPQPLVQQASAIYSTTSPSPCETSLTIKCLHEYISSKETLTPKAYQALHFRSLISVFVPR